MAIVLMHRALLKAVRRIGFAAYQANIVAYTLAWLGWCTGGRVDFDGIWGHQGISVELEAVFEEWARAADQVLRSSAGSRMPTEWAKKPECWEAFKQALPTLPKTLPRELASQAAMPAGARQADPAVPALTSDDLALISKAREIDPMKWLQIANWGQRNRKTYRLAGIASTLAQYAADGWIRSPSIKQAKWGLELARLHDETLDD